MPPGIFLDVVKQIIKKLPEEWAEKITKEHIKKTQEKWRILEARIGSRDACLAKGDAKESRAAVLLEYVVRKEGGHHLPMALLAKAVGMKAPTLKNLHHVIGNHLSPLPSPQRQQRPSKRPGASSSFNRHGKPQSSLTSKRRKVDNGNIVTKTPGGPTGVTATMSNIPNLALRLAGQMTDPHGFGQAAEALLEKIAQHTSSMNVHNRRGHDYDLKRYRAAYEAACLYHVATRDNPTGTNWESKGSTTTQRRRYSRSNNIGDHDSDEEEKEDYVGNTPKRLTLEDLVAVSNDFTLLELENILPRVKDLSNQINSNKQEKGKQLKKNKGKTPKTRQAGVPGNCSIKSSTSNLLATILDRRIPEEDQESKKTSREGEAPEAKASPEEWKEQILGKARQEAKEQIHQQTGMLMDIISESMAIAHAADAVLRKHGLL